MLLAMAADMAAAMEESMVVATEATTEEAMAAIAAATEEAMVVAIATKGFKHLYDTQ